MGHFDLFSRKDDQITLAHKVFYSNYANAIKSLYEDFIKEVVTTIVDTEFYYQKIPTFRIGLPGNRIVGEYHSDKFYNHKEYEVNFNLGLSSYQGPSALRIEQPDGTFRLLECPYGEIFSFDHIDCIHGSDPNKSDSTMTSFDFRIAIKDLYYECNNASVNMGCLFAPGHYFSSNAVGLTAAHC